MGIVFTPKPVCSLISKRVISNSKGIKQGLIEDFIIIDPACGTGYLLLDFVMQLLSDRTNKSNIRKIFTRAVYGTDIEKKNVQFVRALLKTLYMCIFCLDDQIEKYQGRTKSHISKDLNSVFRKVDEHIIMADFLRHRPFGDLKFDYIIANPPYIRVHKMSQKLNRYLRKEYYTPYRDFDIYICFFERGLQVLKDDGILGFITPEKYLQRLYGTKLRKFILSNSYILELINISRCYDVFEVDVYPLITILQKRTIKSWKYLSEDDLMRLLLNQVDKNPKMLYLNLNGNFQENLGVLYDFYSNTGTCIDTDNEKDHPISVSYYDYQEVIGFLRNTNFQFSVNSNRVFRSLQRRVADFITFREISDKNSIICGTPRAKDYKKLTKGLREHRELQGANNENLLPYIVSRNIFPFNIVWGLNVRSIGDQYRNPMFDLRSGPFSKNVIERFFIVPKLVIRANSKRIIAAVDNQGYVFNGVYSIKMNQDLIHDVLGITFTEHHLSLLLNSNLINFYVLKRFHTYMVNSEYLSVNRAVLSDIPLPFMKNGGENNIENTNATKNLQELSRLGAKIETISKKVSKLILSKDRENMENILRILRNPNSDDNYILLDHLNETKRRNGENGRLYGLLKDYLASYARLNEKVCRLYKISKETEEKINDFFSRRDVHNSA